MLGAGDSISKIKLKLYFGGALLIGVPVANEEESVV